MPYLPSSFPQKPFSLLLFFSLMLQCVAFSRHAGLRASSRLVASSSLSSSSSTPPPASSAFLLEYNYVEGILDKRAPHRAGHLALLTDLKEKGLLKAAGAYDPPTGATFIFLSPLDTVQTFVANVAKLADIILLFINHVFICMICNYRIHT